MSDHQQIEKIGIIAADGVASEVSAFVGQNSQEELSDNSPVLLWLPAMGIRASFYKPLGEPLATQGIRLVTADLRGHGLSSVRPSRNVQFGYQQIVELDLPETVAVLKGKYPQSKIFVGGHSLGGQLVCLFAARFPESLSGVLTVASCSVYWRAFPASQRWQFFFFTRFFELWSRLFGVHPGTVFGFGGKESGQLIGDWASQGKTGDYQVMGSEFDFEAGLNKVTMPVLMINIAGDLYAPEPATDHLAEKLLSSSVSRVTMGAPAGQTAIKPHKRYHFDWVKNHAKEVAVEFSRWLAVND